jgi:hypothetical protein
MEGAGAVGCRIWMIAILFVVEVGHATPDGKESAIEIATVTENVLLIVIATESDWV